jgi:hypothetical protein
MALTQAELQHRHRRTLKGTISNKRQSAQKRAKRDGYEFDISTEFLHCLWKQQDGKCALTGVEMGFIGQKWLSPSIDRIDNSKGYTEDNVQWVCWRANDAKSNMNNGDFVTMCLAVAATYFKGIK